jgi:hypothetical protein
MNENHEERVEDRVQALLEVADNNPHRELVHVTYKNY